MTKFNKITAITMAVVAIITLFGCKVSASELATQNSMVVTANDADENELRDAIARHAHTFNFNMAVRNDGVAMYKGDVLDGWTDVASVVDLDYFYGSPVALRWDGTVLTGDNNPIVSTWRNIVAICDSIEGIVGLRLDGTVVSSNPDSVCNTWTNVEMIHASGCAPYLLGITKDGKALCVDESYDLSTWTDIIQISNGWAGVVGVRRDGTVLYNDGTGSKVMEGWTDVVAADCYWDIMALRKDGSIITTAKEIYRNPVDFSGWKNIKEIDVWGYDFLGIKEDGSIITVGGFDYLYYENSDFSEWKNMVEVKMGGYSIIGLREDGTVLADYGPGTEHLYTDVKVHTIPKPSEEDVKSFGDVITYPQAYAYLDSYETKYVKAPQGNSIYVFWNYNGGVATSRRKFNLYEGDEVTVIARQGTRSCVIFTDKSGKKQIGWVNSDYLVFEGPKEEMKNLVPGPSVEDVKPFGNVITYPDPGTYLDSYETKYVKAPKGNSVYVFWNYNGGVATSKRKFNLYEGDEVTVLARQGTRSCVIFKDKSGKEQIGWVNSDYLVSE